jgi:Glycogen recognition site of AMP-activated protein kinase
MLMHPSPRPHPEATEVYVTGTFDDWGKTEKLDKVGDTFEKDVQLSDATQKILYKVSHLSIAVPSLDRRPHRGRPWLVRVKPTPRLNKNGVLRGSLTQCLRIVRR